MLKHVKEEAFELRPEEGAREARVAPFDPTDLAVLVIFINDVCFLLPPSCRSSSNKDRESNNVVSYSLPWFLLFLSCSCLLVCMFVYKNLCQ